MARAKEVGEELAEEEKVGEKETVDIGEEEKGDWGGEVAEGGGREAVLFLVEVGEELEAMEGGGEKEVIELGEETIVGESLGGRGELEGESLGGRGEVGGVSLGGRGEFMTAGGREGEETEPEVVQKGGGGKEGVEVELEVEEKGTDSVFLLLEGEEGGVCMARVRLPPLRGDFGSRGGETRSSPFEVV